MSINSPENQEEDYGNVWQKVYRIIAIILLVSMLLNLLGTLMMMLGISWDGLIVLFFFPVPRIGIFF